MLLLVSSRLQLARRERRLDRLHLQRWLYGAQRRLVLSMSRWNIQGGGGIGGLHGVLGRQVLDGDGGVVVERLHRLPCE